MNIYEKNVLKAARLWWSCKKPLAYTLKQHLENPLVNANGDIERTLARHVGKLVAKEKLL